VDSLTHLTPSERRELFESVAAAPAKALPRPVPIEVIEKDAWVCFALRRLFGLPMLRRDAGEPAVVFKGGTSLSKGYGLIHRFSEDVDLTLDPALFGVVLATPGSSLSKSAQKRQMESAVAGCEAFVGGSLLHALEGDLASVLGPGPWVTVDPMDRGTLLFAYPGTGLGTAAYILPRVRLEFGVRSEREPWESRPIQSYAAQARPDAGLDAAFLLPILKVERTIWEKATLLHAENARARIDSKSLRGFERQSRHASDLSVMSPTEAVSRAISDTQLLRRVCACKQARFPASHVDYDAVDPSTIEIVPRERLEPALARDYEAMTSMFFEDPPPWESVLAELRALEARVRAVDHEPR
jgi:hypothetical protein